MTWYSFFFLVCFVAGCRTNKPTDQAAQKRLSRDGNLASSHSQERSDPGPVSQRIRGTSHTAGTTAEKPLGERPSKCPAWRILNPKSQWLLFHVISDDLGMHHLAVVNNRHFWQLQRRGERRWRVLWGGRVSSVQLPQKIHWKWFVQVLSLLWL